MSACRKTCVLSVHMSFCAVLCYFSDHDLDWLTVSYYEINIFNRKLVVINNILTNYI